jgi:N-acetylmuramidase
VQPGDGRLLHCAESLARYAAAVDAACRVVAKEAGRGDPAGVGARDHPPGDRGYRQPRFSSTNYRLNQQHPRTGLEELRYRSMSIGLGQIMGFNHRAVGAPSARAMIAAPVDEQVLYVARFLGPEAPVCGKLDPKENDFRRLTRFYNGPQYHAHFYDERLARWFREFRRLRQT